MSTDTKPNTPTMAPHIDQLRQHLMDTLADLRNRDKPMEPDRARAVAQVAGVLIDTAKVEIEYLKATGQDRSNFLEIPPDADVAGLGNTPQTTPRNGIASITRHHLRG
ncbi:MAG: hypothetical protein Q8R67_02520 [Rhodoferax sp.]|nr:hypothetical protein [Rhodoferax sp.]MDP3650535.1 hypothetical protein [Rhodoferax sp.]